MGADQMLLDSDLPHSEGMTEPHDWLKQVADLYPARDVAQMIGKNIYGLLGQ